MPSASDAWRAAISSAFTSWASAPNLDARLAVARERVEIGRGNAIGRGRADDLGELILRIEREGLHAMAEIGLGNDFLGLDRVHEALDGLGQRLGDQADL